MMNIETLDPELSEAELLRITKYHRPSGQMRFFKELGVRAKLRRDNTVLVLRMDLYHPSATQVSANDAPKLKSSRK